MRERHPRRRLKYGLDRLLAVVLLILTAPVFALVALLLWWRGDGVVFTQERVGEDGRSFRVLKFTTMPPGSERGGWLTRAADPRPTPIGRLLRATKVNELPQLINVLRGEMSLVGPRPMVRAHLAESLSADEIRAYYRMRPGLTGAASVEFAREDRLLAGQSDPERYFHEVLLPRKMQLEARYAAGWSLAGDVAILLRTLGGLLR